MYKQRENKKIFCKYSAWVLHLRLNRKSPIYRGLLLSSLLTHIILALSGEHSFQKTLELFPKKHKEAVAKE